MKLNEIKYQMFEILKYKAIWNWDNDTAQLRKYLIYPDNILNALAILPQQYERTQRKKNITDG